MDHAEVSQSDLDRDSIKADIELAQKRLFEICMNSSRFRMSIPLQRDDDDQLFQRVIDFARASIEHQKAKSVLSDDENKQVEHIRQWIHFQDPGADFLLNLIDRLTGGAS